MKPLVSKIRGKEGFRELNMKGCRMCVSGVGCMATARKLFGEPKEVFRG